MPDPDKTPPHRSDKTFAREVAEGMAEDARSGFKLALGIGVVLAILGSGYGLVAHGPLTGLILGGIGFVAGMIIGGVLVLMPLDLF